MDVLKHKSTCHVTHVTIINLSANTLYLRNVSVQVIDVLIEGEAWLSRTGGIGGLSGSDIVLSGPTEGEYWDVQYQHVAPHAHCSMYT